MAGKLIQEAKEFFVDEMDNDVWLDGSVFAIDATTNDTSLSTFRRETFRTTKVAIKLHTQLDLSTTIPEFNLVTPASVHVERILDLIKFEANNFYIIERGYLDLKRLSSIYEQGA